MSLVGRIGIVTGGSRGIGRGVVLALARAGADVAFCYSKDEEGAKETTAQVEALGRECLSYRADVTDFEKVREMVGKTVETFGAVDILVNNAGIGGDGNYLVNENIESMHRVINTHIFGSLHFVKAVLPHMRKRKRGDIYFISSTATLDFRPRGAAYTIAKVGMEAMAKCLAKEELRYNIRVNAIAPGVTDTGEHLVNLWRLWYPELKELKELYSIMPFGRCGKPEDFGNLIAFLASEEGGWISGQVIYVDGGARGLSVPRLLAYG